MNILFTCAGRRTYLLKYFKENLSKGDKIVATDMQLSAPALSVADIVEQVPAVYNPNYIDILLSICQRYEENLLISLNDLELPLLAENRDKFKELGVILLVSSPKVIDICFDKYKTTRFVSSIGLKTPQTYVNFQDAMNAIQNGCMFFPIVLKPRWGSGSIGIEYVEDLEEFKMIYQLLYRKIKRTILSKASIGNEYILIQEKIKASEYGLDIMNDLNGKHIAVSVKRKLAMRAGETDKAITVDNEELRSIGHIIGSQLSHIGNLDCDILEQNGEYYVLDLNPRFGGGFPFSYEAGVNMPKAIIEWVKGNIVDLSILQPQYGKLFSKCDYLVEIRKRNDPKHL